MFCNSGLSHNNNNVRQSTLKTLPTFRHKYDMNYTGSKLATSTAAVYTELF